MNKIEFNQKRANLYSLAMKNYSISRKSELENFELKGNPKKIIAGEGFLTKYLSKKFIGSEIYALDTSDFMLSQIPKSNNLFCLNRELEELPFKENSIDLIISLAGFHHIKNREIWFKKAKRLLEQKGYIEIADVHNGTSTQNFFDDVIKKYCITGHDFPFIDTEKIRKISEENNLHLEKSEIRDTPWKFRSKEDMLIFVKHLFGLKIKYGLLEKELNKHFDIKNNTIPWQLGYHSIKNENKENTE